MRIPGLLFAALLTTTALPSQAAEPLHVTPDTRSPLATTASLVERQFSPLDGYQILRKMHAAGVTDTLDENLAHTPLLVRMPDKPAADGRYGLLVFLGSNKQARYEFEWSNALDAHGVIFVSPDNAGDEASILEQRMPLALHAYEYARSHYNLDPDRIYIAGAGSGARIAQRLALSYPDIFSGVIANVGAAELGTEAPVPTPALLQRLRTHSSLLFATSRHDQPAFSEQQRTLKSLRAYCVANVRDFDNGHTVAGHAAITGVFMNDFLDAFSAPRSTDAQAQAACEQGVDRDAAAALGNIRRLRDAGRREEALKALAVFDHAYGHLLRDDELALARDLNPTFFDAPAPPAPVQASH